MFECIWLLFKCHLDIKSIILLTYDTIIKNANNKQPDKICPEE